MTPNQIAFALSNPRVRCRECLVNTFLHMIENDQPNCRKRDGSKASSNKHFHVMLSLEFNRTFCKEE